jgi:hypothetical protein
LSSIHSYVRYLRITIPVLPAVDGPLPPNPLPPEYPVKDIDVAAAPGPLVDPEPPLTVVTLDPGL